MYTWFVFFYTRQAKADYYIYQPPPNATLSKPSTLQQSVDTCETSLPMYPSIFYNPMNGLWTNTGWL